jgi:hypothetical protein
MKSRKSLATFSAHDNELHDTKAALRSALLKLHKMHRSREELVKVVQQSAKDAISALEIKPVVPIKPDIRRAGTPQTAICVLSDWQLAKITATYSSTIAERRVEEYAAKVARIIQAHRGDHPVDSMHVYLLGDIVEGEQIFPGQAHLIDASVFRQTLVDGPRIIGNFLRQALTMVPKVEVYGVIGNHGALGGRSRREYHPESNADLMVYEVTRQLLEGQKGLKWGPLEDGIRRRWYQTPKPAGIPVFCFHGDQIKGGFAGFPWYAFAKKVLGWDRKHRFRYAFSGHFHTPVRQYINGIVLWGNGSLESDNDYAEEYMAATGEPSQWLIFMHPKLGVTAEHCVRLT